VYCTEERSLLLNNTSTNYKISATIQEKEKNQNNVKELTLYPDTTFTCSGDRCTEVDKRYVFTYPRFANFAKQTCLKFKFNDILDTPFSVSQIIENIEIEIGGCLIEVIRFCENNMCVSSVRRNVIISPHHRDYGKFHGDEVVKETKITAEVDFTSHDEIIVPLSILFFDLNDYKLFLMPNSKYETRLIINFKNYYCITSTTVLLHSLP